VRKRYGLASASGPGPAVAFVLVGPRGVSLVVTHSSNGGIDAGAERYGRGSHLVHG
jgi:hypothetical protein